MAQRLEQLRWEPSLRVMAVDPAAASDDSGLCRLRGVAVSSLGVDGRRVRRPPAALTPTRIGRPGRPRRTRRQAYDSSKALDDEVRADLVLPAPRRSPSTSVASRAPTWPGALDRQAPAAGGEEPGAEAVADAGRVERHASPEPPARRSWSRSRPVTRTPSLPSVVRRMPTRSRIAASESPVFDSSSSFSYSLRDQVCGAIDQAGDVFTRHPSELLRRVGNEGVPRSRHSWRVRKHRGGVVGTHDDQIRPAEALRTGSSSISRASLVGAGVERRDLAHVLVGRCRRSARVCASSRDVHRPAIDVVALEPAAVIEIEVTTHRAHECRAQAKLAPYRSAMFAAMPPPAHARGRPRGSERRPRAGARPSLLARTGPGSASDGRWRSTPVTADPHVANPQAPWTGRAACDSATRARHGSTRLAAHWLAPVHPRGPAPVLAAPVSHQTGQWEGRRSSAGTAARWDCRS